VTAWTLSLDAWIVQDGNYGDFARGRQIEVAVEAWGVEAWDFSELRPVDAPAVGATPVEADVYDVVGRIVVVEPALVLDVGILVFSEAPAPAAPGTVVAGRIGLGVDPFMYFERLAKDDRMPPLIYTWRIDRILLETTPWVESAPRTFERAADATWSEVAATDAWEDDSGSASYLLECVLLDIEPKRRSATAA